MFREYESADGDSAHDHWSVRGGNHGNYYRIQSRSDAEHWRTGYGRWIYRISQRLERNFPRYWDGWHELSRKRLRVGYYISA